MESDQFHYPFELLNDEDHSKQDNILECIPKNLKHLRFFGFLYGAFNDSHLNLKDKDFIFTLIEHPIDRIYNLYSFWDNIKNTQNQIINKYYYYKEGINIIEQNPIPSYQEYIDLIINRKDFIFKYGSISYKLSNELIYGFDLKKMNYIGKISNINKSFIYLSEIFKKKIPDLHLDYKKNNIDYRYKELEKLFIKEIDFYNNLQ